MRELFERVPKAYLDEMRTETAWTFMIKDPTADPPKGHFDKSTRDAYNLTWRRMTPVYHYPGGGTLWLGGQNAANGTDMLHSNRITTRFSTKETYACKRTIGIQDWRPFRIDDILSKGAGGYHDWIKMKQRVIDIEEALRRGENILVFCREGARRPAIIVGIYLMAKQVPQQRMCTTT